MIGTEWYNLIKNSEKTALLGNDLKKVHYKMPNGREMVEEYSLNTGVLCKRAWKISSGIYKASKWEIEVGDPVSERNEDNDETIGIKESENSPFVAHRVTKSKLEWRIRNLPYALDVYHVTVNPEGKCIVVRTSNKKYFKKIPMLELQRLNIIPDSNFLKISHACNTLIISYEKPPELVAFEKLIQDEIKNIKIIDNADIDCKQS